MVEVPRNLACYVELSVTGSNRVSGGKESCVHADASVEAVDRRASVYLNVGSFNVPGEHDEIFEEIVVTTCGHVELGSANTAGGRRGIMLLYTVVTVWVAVDSLLCWSFDLYVEVVRVLVCVG